MKKSVNKISVFLRGTLISVTLISCSMLQAQSEYLLHGFRVIPQNSYTNPAFAPDTGFVFGFPLLSSVSNSTYSTGFTYNDILTRHEGSDSLYLDLAPLIHESNSLNYLAEAGDYDMLYFGFRAGNGFMGIGIRQRFYARAFYNNDMISLLWYGNASSITQEKDLSQCQLNAEHFVSYYISYAFPIGKFVKIGARINLNRGIANIQTAWNETKLLTDENNASVYALYGVTDFRINTSGIEQEGDEGFNIMRYYYNYRNFGFSLDLGADIRVSERFNVNLSLTDFGYIDWTSNLKNYQSNDSIYFEGINLDDEDYNEGIFIAYADTLKSLLSVEEYSEEYRSQLPKRMIAGAEYYSKDRSGSISLMFAGRFMKNYFEPSFSVAYDKTLSSYFAVKLSYTYLRYAPLNIGAGLAFNLGPLQLYFLTDNVIAAFNYKNQQYINFHFGVNLVYGR